MHCAFFEAVYALRKWESGGDKNIIMQSRTAEKKVLKAVSEMLLSIVYV